MHISAKAHNTLATDIPHVLLSVGREQEHLPTKGMIKLPVVPPLPASLAIECTEVRQDGINHSIRVETVAIIAYVMRVGATRASPSGEPPTIGGIIAPSFVWREPSTRSVRSHHIN